MELGCWFYRGREARKEGKIKFKIFPQKAPPRIQNLGGNRGYNWKAFGERILAGQVLKVQVVGRPPPWQAGQGSKGSIRIAGRPPQIGGLPCVHNTNMWSKPRKYEPRERKANFLEGFKRVRDNYWPAYSYWWPPGVYNTNMGFRA